jgi:two-component system, chemotaxis family, chemotaxis protein CheY
VEVSPAEKKLRILVVDDHALTRSMVQSILRSAGYSEVIHADNGEHAIRRLGEQRMDLVVCDWNMPTVSGIDVLRFMRKNDDYQNIPFIMLTAEAYRKNVKEAIDAGVTDYVVKPFTPEVLLEKVQGVIRKIALTRG